MSAVRHSGRRTVVFLTGLLGALMLAACGCAATSVLNGFSRSRE